MQIVLSNADILETTNILKHDKNIYMMPDKVSLISV